MQPHHPQTPSRDRFIANRSAIDLDVARYALEGKSSTENSNDDENGGRMDDDGKQQQSIGIASPSKEAYKKSLASNYSVQNGGENGDHMNSKILAFKSKAPAPPSGMENAAREMYSSTHIGVLKGGKKQFRHIPQAPERSLDAQELVDDYYLNLIDWSSQNSIAVALGCTVYLWNAGTGAIDQLMQTDVENEEEDYVTSVNWAPDGKHIAVGTNNDLGRIESEESENVERPRGESWRFGVERDAVGDWFQRYDGDDARREDSRALHEHVHVSLTRGLRVEMVAERDAVSFGWERQLVAYL